MLKGSNNGVWASNVPIKTFYDNFNFEIIILPTSNFSDCQDISL